MDKTSKRTIAVTYLSSFYILFYIHFFGHLAERSGLEFIAFLTVLLVIVLMFYSYIALWSVLFAFVKLRTLKALAFAPFAMVLVTVFCIAVRFKGAGVFLLD